MTQSADAAPSAPDATEAPETDAADAAEADAAGADATETIDVDALPGGARAAVEAVLMVVEEPVDELVLAAVLERPVEEVRAHLADIEERYADGSYGFTVRHVGEGWRFYSHSAYASVVERFVLDGRQSRLSKASLETLAVIAYRQPISRGRISAVRGVSVDGVVRTLLTRGLITEVDDPDVGGAVRYATTPYFLERMGLTSLDDLPAIAPFLPEADALDDLLERDPA